MSQGKFARKPKPSFRQFIGLMLAVFGLAGLSLGSSSTPSTVSPSVFSTSSTSTSSSVATVAVSSETPAPSATLTSPDIAVRLSLSPPTPTDSPTVAAPSYRVIRVVDGDTIVVNIGGQDQTIRLIGVNTPETVDPSKPMECYGAEASSETHRLADGQSVTLAADPTQGNVDKYGRLLRYVYLPDGRNLEETLIIGGYGWEYTYIKAYQLQNEFRAAQASAQAAGEGLWSASTCAGREEPASDCVIKGNISATGEKIYHLPGQKYYAQTVIDEAKGERWFCTEAEAQAAGWRKSKI